MSRVIRITLVSALLLILPVAALAAGIMDDETFDTPNAVTMEQMSKVEPPSDSSADTTENDGGCSSVKASLLPPLVIETAPKPAPAGGLVCPSEFNLANSCSECWDAYHTCRTGGALTPQDCYSCLEICLGRLNCWIP
jgi:hypothetical protein